MFHLQGLSHLLSPLDEKNRAGLIFDYVPKSFSVVWPCELKKILVLRLPENRRNNITVAATRDR